jgi:hypothetical protein
MLYSIISNPDQQEKTILDIDSDTATMTVKLQKGSQLEEIRTVKLNNLFSIRFSKYDLKENRMFWGYWEYTTYQSTLSASSDGSGGVILKYTSVNPVRVVCPRPARLPVYVQDLKTIPVPQPIQVTVFIKPAESAPNAGWINMDIEHTYPAQFSSGNGAFAWEPKLIFPIMHFEEGALREESPLTFVTPPLQFAAVYQPAVYPPDKPKSGINFVSGVAVLTDNERGHATQAYFDKENRQLSFALLNPIHLKKSTGAPGQADAVEHSYIRPDRYRLSGQGGHTDYGYGGNAVMYRIRAFQIDGACKGSPADWHDVLHIYRRWLKVRRPAFYSRLIPNRPTNSPVDTMSPHTIIANYGLDGPIDPPPANSRFPELHQWLELHPIKSGEADMTGNKNESLLDLFKRLKQRFQVTGLKLEAQIWGFEMAGFYRFLGGFPPVTNVLSEDPTKFTRAMKELADNGIIVSITTDPFSALFNRYRFRGHLIWVGTDWADITNSAKWKHAIPYSFPTKLKSATCAATNVSINGVQFDRVWVVLPGSGISPSPTCGDAETMKKFQKLDAYGVPREPLSLIGSGLYRATQKEICPTQEFENIYVNKWLKNGLFQYGARLIEIMKHSFQGRCYDRTHQHIVPVPPIEEKWPFDNLIGCGSWYVKRCQRVLNRVQTLGQGLDPNNSFSVTNEFTPIEAMVPYLDEYYPTDEYFHYVYSELLTPKMSLGGKDWAIHPGYKERRKKVNELPPTNYARPDYMLHSDRDEEDKPAVQLALTKSFKTWQLECVNYFNKYFEVANYGIAPKHYPTAVLSGTPKPPIQGDPLPQTNPSSYTYNRCIQDVFNLRPTMFETGRSAVLGERILVPSVWFEGSYGYDQPYPYYDYNEEAINVAVRAVQLQMTFKDFFRGGFMLGEETIRELELPSGKIIKGNRSIWAWRTLRRSFDDVSILVDSIAKDDIQLGTDLRLSPVKDFISEGIDKESFNRIDVYSQIQHRIWQRGDGQTRRVLYVFANLGNGDVTVSFNYGRGLEGVTASSGWQKTITKISDVITPQRWRRSTSILRRSCA